MNDDIEFVLGRLDSRLFGGDDPSELLETLKPMVRKDGDFDEIISTIKKREMFVDVSGNQDAICEWVKAVKAGDLESEKRQSTPSLLIDSNRNKVKSMEVFSVLALTLIGCKPAAPSGEYPISSRKKGWRFQPGGAQVSC